MKTELFQSYGHCWVFQICWHIECSTLTASSSHVWTPKSQHTAEQPLTGKCWIPPKKDTPHPRAKEKPQQDGRRGKIAFRIKPHTCQRYLDGSNKTLSTPGPRDPTETETDIESPVEVWVSSGLPQGQGLWMQLPGAHSLWPKPSWRRSQLIPTTELPSRQPTNCKTVYQRNSLLRKF